MLLQRSQYELLRRQKYKAKDHWSAVTENKLMSRCYELQNVKQSHNTPSLGCTLVKLKGARDFNLYKLEFSKIYFYSGHFIHINKVQVEMSLNRHIK